MLITTSLGWPRSATAAMTWPARTRSAAFSSLTARRLDDDPALARVLGPVAAQATAVTGKVCADLLVCP
jgi:hypothetical protein